MSNPLDVETYIDKLNARRGRGPEAEGDDEEEGDQSHNDRLRESILDGDDGGD